MEIGIDSFIATGAYEGALNPQAKYRGHRSFT